MNYEPTGEGDGRSNSSQARALYGLQASVCLNRQETQGLEGVLDMILPSLQCLNPMTPVVADERMAALEVTNISTGPVLFPGLLMCFSHVAGA